jgi:hypothetical protein
VLLLKVLLTELLVVVWSSIVVSAEESEESVEVNELAAS